MLKTANPSSQTILETASRLFAEKGYANVSIRDVCREAKTTAPMIYYYFKDKRGLFQAAVDSRVSMRDFIRLIKKSTSGKDAVSNLEWYVRVYLSSFPTQAFQPGLYIVETGELDKASAEKISEQLDEVRQVAVSIIQQGESQKAFVPFNPEDAADCLIGMLNHIVFQRVHFARATDIEKAGSTVSDFFLRAMKRPQ